MSSPGDGRMFPTMTVTTSAEQTPEPAPDPTPARRWPPLWWRRFRRLPAPVRGATYVAVALVLVLVVSTLAGVVLVRRSFPQTSGTIEVPGLAGRVDVVRDDRGIPQIYADTTEDLMFAQGFVHAQERFFEMDVRRHATAGRLAEMFGEDAVESDVLVRTMGWRTVAERELPRLAPDTRVALGAYADGVNAYLDDRGPTQISLEYAVLDAGGLDYTPEPWTAVDSLAWLKAMAWDLRGNMQDEIDRVGSIDAVGRTRAEQLFPSYSYDEHPPAVTQGKVVDGVFEQNATKNDTRLPTRVAPSPALDGAPVAGALDGLSRLGRATGRMPAWLGRGDGLGSNAWVVSGEHTTTGAPLLANDPHLGTSVPGVWMQVGLHCRSVSADCPYDVAGFSFAGMPGVVIGHNADVAWGFTNLGADVTDLYVERVQGDTWRYAGEQRPLRTHEETIEVEGADDVTIEVRATRHGPIVSDADGAVGDQAADVAGRATVPRPEPAPGAAAEDYVVSLAWTALKPSRTADAILALDRATDWTDFRDAVSTFAAPGQNMVYADRAGHVGYQATGLVPIRKSGNDGRLPSAGWRPENDWSGDYVPFDGLPSVLDPDEGFVVTANQAVVGNDYPYALTDDWDLGYRSDRIRQLVTDGIADGGTLSVDDLTAMQLDTRNPLGPVLTPYLLDARLPRGYYSAGQRLLRTWDFDQPADSAAAAYFNAVWKNLLALTFGDELPEDLWPDGGQRWVAVVSTLLEHPDDEFWDDVATDDRETRDDVVAQAMRDARDELTARQATSPDDWSWGGLHQLDLTSPRLGTLDSGVARRLFDRGGWDASGGSTAVDATAWDAAVGYAVTTAPSMRMVISLADLDDSRWVALTGVSGHAFHDHYTDQTDLWADGRTLPWLFTEDDVRDAGDDVLVLEPASDDD